MSEFVPPGWFGAMIASGAGAAEGVRWFTPEERAAALRDRPAAFPGRGLWMMDDQREAADAGWRTKVKVGEGPPIYIDHAASYRLEFWLDAENPDAVLAGFENAPPFLWFPVGRTAAALPAALRPYLPPDLARPRAFVSPLARIRAVRQAAHGPIPEATPDQDRSARLMVGIALAGVGKDFAEVENHLLLTRLADPAFLMQGTVQDNPRSNPAVTVLRTLYSRSTVRLDWYDNLHGTLFAEISYAPAGQGDVVRAFNDRFGLHFPADVPLDVPALLLGMEAISVPAVRAHMARRVGEPDKLSFYLHCLAILSDPDVAEQLRPHAKHPSPVVRGTVIDLAARRAPELLREMRAAETDPALRAKIDAALAE